MSNRNPYRFFPAMEIVHYAVAHAGHEKFALVGRAVLKFPTSPHWQRFGSESSAVTSCTQRDDGGCGQDFRERCCSSMGCSAKHCYWQERRAASYLAKSSVQHASDLQQT